MKQKRYANREIDVVNFYGDELAVVSIPELNTLGVALVDICKSLNIDYSTQFRKVSEQPRFQGHSVEIKGRRVLTIPITKLNAFLFSINPNSVGDGFITRNGVDVSKKDMLIKYQDECAIVLHDYWMHGLSINNRKVPYLMDDEDVSPNYGPVAASRPRLRRVMVSFCDYAEQECQYPIVMDDLYTGLTNIFADFVPVPLIKDPSLATSKSDIYSARDLWMLAILENAAADALKNIQFKALDVSQAFNLVDEYLIRTVEVLGHHFVTIRSTFNHGNGIMG